MAFAVYEPHRFGTRGAQIPALIRGGVAIVWFGIQTYLASMVLDVLLAILLGFPTGCRGPDTVSVQVRHSISMPGMMRPKWRTYSASKRLRISAWMSISGRPCGNALRQCDLHLVPLPAITDVHRHWLLVSDGYRHSEPDAVREDAYRNPQLPAPQCRR
ncbi:cytosine permease [Paracoccus mutanolyticus]|uniref:cytosine permease n=1 Tax=Paracoccus mutanolyticus TaxID=1499308 RepID=UPI001CB99427|nr:cytosine permease [Paracoccus mutanolyticus]